MASIAPPHRPLTVALADEGGLNRLRLRLFQLVMSFLTVLATTWFIMLGPIPGIIALTFAKHVLVAILVMGLGVDASEPGET
jgi:hypothetical protein